MAKSHKKGMNVFFEIEKLEFGRRSLRRELLDSARSPRSRRDGRCKNYFLDCYEVEVRLIKLASLKGLYFQ